LLKKKMREETVLERGGGREGEEDVAEGKGH
jgi:hypothetical protein